MPFGLSFTEEFFTGTEPMENIEPSKRPTNVLQAIISMAELEPTEFAYMVAEEFPEYSGFECAEALPYAILDRVREIDTCTGLTPPVEVWVDRAGYITLAIHEPEKEE